MADRYFIITGYDKETYKVLAAEPTVDLAIKAYARIEREYPQGEVRLAKALKVERGYSIKGDDGE